MAPIWFRPSIGALLRGGIDYRSYLHQIALLGLFRRGSCELGYWRGIWRARNAGLIRESEVDELATIITADIEAHVLFDRPYYRFTPLLGSESFLLSELRGITRPCFLPLVDTFDYAFVGINVRCGKDFKAPPMVGEYYDRVGWLQRTPLSWYVESLMAIREACGQPVPAVLVSNGTEHELSDILALGNVHFLRPGRAITDLLVLSKACVLLASATSTFSAWATFLGGMPAVTAPGHPLTEWGLLTSDERYVGDFDPRRPDRRFLDQAARLLQVDIPLAN
jgi:hypothetical protein